MDKSFKKIQKWIYKKGYTLRFGMSDAVDYDKKEVILRRSQSNILFAALHECGHIVVGNKDNYHRDYKSIIKADTVDGRHYRSNLYRYKKIKEEIEAWEEGFKLSKKLGIDVDKDDYDKYASKYLITYTKI
jgi:hypothetical protein